jgi:hypothetical protein
LGLGSPQTELRNVLQFPFTADIVPSSPILVTLMMEVMLSSETSLLRSATRRHTQNNAFFRTPNVVNKFSWCLKTFFMTEFRK